MLAVFVVDESDSKSLLWNICGSERPLPVVTAARAIDFHFSTKKKTYNSGVYAVGFKLWLTFFDAEKGASGKELPERQLPPNWPWPDFKSPEKTREGNCKGDGLVWYSGVCFKILSPEKKRHKKSWAMADSWCRKGNATLPALKTPREWQALIDFVNSSEFQGAGAFSLLYVGLQFGKFSAPGYDRVPLYEGLGQWTDGTVAFFLRDVRLTAPTSTPVCTAFTAINPAELISVGCNEVHTTRVVCQVHHGNDRGSKTANMASEETVPTVTDPPSYPVEEDKKALEKNLSRLVKCPMEEGGHFVHADSVCDLDCFGTKLFHPHHGQEKPGSREKQQRTSDWQDVFRDPLPSWEECPWPLTPPSSSSSASSSPPPPLRPPPYFTCDTGTQRVPFASVCDRRQNCGDGSDELFCWFPAGGGSVWVEEEEECPGARVEQVFFSCDSGSTRCIDKAKQCDGLRDCSDGSDEFLRYCGGLEDPRLELAPLLNTLPPPALVDTNRHGGLTLRVLGDPYLQVKVKDVNPMVARGSLEKSFTCPADTHFRCSLFCMPVYLRCNGVWDCPGGGDEMGCESYQCPGYYRCTSFPKKSGGGVRVCVHLGNVCDGVRHCPLGDDESFCGNFTCPDSCSCQYGPTTFTCSKAFDGKDYPSLRYLHAEESGMKLEHVNENRALVYLNLASCKITTLQGLNHKLHSLRTLDLSYNKLKKLESHVLMKFPHLRDLSLRSNPLVFPFTEKLVSLPALERLDLSQAWMFKMDSDFMSTFDLPYLHILNLSHTGLECVTDDGFQLLGSLRILDMRGCPMRDFTEDVFTPLVQLQRMFASNSKLCCPANLPDNEGFEGCSAPEDPSTSCDSLLYSNAYRVLLIVFASLALGGNMGGFVYRMFINKDEESHSCGVMVTHLCMSDFLMGVYLVVIGVADTRYGSSYFIYSDAWERSAGCKAAGFLSLLSCEASAFFVCLLTIDRMAAFRFPNSRLHFRKGSAQLTCWMIWFAAVFMAAVPLIESHWRFYGETGTCLPLPTNARSFDGRDYSFAVLIMLNFVLFLIIAVGQALIYCSVRARRHKTLGVNSDYMSLERSITKRLIAIALTDFLCWFPVCLVGFMASGGGARMPRHIDTALSVAVLPLNSAINPFIYTLVMIRETRRHGNSRPRDFLESETSFMMT